MRPVAVGLGADAATLVRVEAEIPSEVPSGVGDVLGEFGDEVQGVEDLEIAGHPRTGTRTDAAEEVTAGWLWEASVDFTHAAVTARAVGVQALAGRADSAGLQGLFNRSPTLRGCLDDGFIGIADFLMLLCRG